MTKTFNKISTNFLKNVSDIAESEGFNTSISEYENGSYFNFQQYTPAGQDFNFEVEAYNIEQLAEEIKNYYENYDVSEQAYLWLDDNGHGTNGAPHDMKDVYEDMGWCEVKIHDLYSAVYKEL